MNRFTDRQKKIIKEIHNSNTFITGKSLSLILNVSLRTIQSEVSAINKKRKEKAMNREEAQMVAFQLISYAGDAFSSFFKAVEKARNGEFDEADELIKKGESELTNAHNAQTELLAKEAQGKDIEYSIMLVHAQDHLMTTIMYERVAKEFITLYKEKLS